MTATSATLGIVVIWLTLGSVTAALLSRRGQPLPTVLSAIGAWPVLLPLLVDGPVSGTGPYAARIATTFAALESAVRDPMAGETLDLAAIAHLREALLRADARLALVDRLLRDELGPDDAPLRTARARAAAEVENVLRGVVQLRAQVGLLALTSDTGPARDRLRDLSQRVRALEEIAPYVPGETDGSPGLSPASSRVRETSASPEVSGGLDSAPAPATMAGTGAA
jgi:hypothetical protein